MMINRCWAMPNKWTFKIKPIAELLKRYVGSGDNWIDPFAGMNSPAEITNDLNPEFSENNFDALSFLKSLSSNAVDGCFYFNHIYIYINRNLSYTTPWILSNVIDRIIIYYITL